MLKELLDFKQELQDEALKAKRKGQRHLWSITLIGTLFSVWMMMQQTFWLAKVPQVCFIVFLLIRGTQSERRLNQHIDETLADQLKELDLLIADEERDSIGKVGL